MNNVTTTLNNIIEENDVFNIRTIMVFDDYSGLLYCCFPDFKYSTDHKLNVNYFDKTLIEGFELKISNKES